MKLPHWLSRQNIILTIIVISISCGMIGTMIGLSNSLAKRRAIPYSFGGDIFAGIKGANGTEKYFGYITDRNINDDKTAMRLTQAQFTLAPAILDLNNVNHRLLIIDFADEKQAIALAVKLTARPLKRSPQGILLVERPGL